MKYYLRTILGSLIALTGIGFFLFGLFILVRGGSCASGGNYVSTRQCPAGSTEWSFALPVAVVVALLGFWLIVRRGPRPGAAPTQAPVVWPAAPAAWSGVRPGAAPAARLDLFQGLLAAQSPGQSDPIAKLERLQALRDNGALSAEEFERAKQKILTEM